MRATVCIINDSENSWSVGERVKKRATMGVIWFGGSEWTPSLWVTQHIYRVKECCWALYDIRGGGWGWGEVFLMCVSRTSRHRIKLKIIIHQRSSVWGERCVSLVKTSLHSAATTTTATILHWQPNQHQLWALRHIYIRKTRHHHLML